MTNATHSPASSGLKVESNGVSAVPEAESVFATANIGVIISMLVGGGIYALLTFGLKVALPGISSQPASAAKAQPLEPQRTV